MEKQRTLESTIGKDVKKAENENKMVAGIMNNITKRDGFTYEVDGTKLMISGESLGENKITVTQVNGQLQAYLRTPDFEELREDILGGKATAEDYQNKVSPLIIATKSNEKGKGWIIERDITQETIQFLPGGKNLDEKALAALTDTIFQLEQDINEANIKWEDKKLEEHIRKDDIDKEIDSYDGRD